LGYAVNDREWERLQAGEESGRMVLSTLNHPGTGENEKEGFKVSTKVLLFPVGGREMGNGSFQH